MVHDLTSNGKETLISMKLQFLHCYPFINKAKIKLGVTYHLAYYIELDQNISQPIFIDR